MHSERIATPLGYTECKRIALQRDCYALCGGWAVWTADPRRPLCLRLVRPAGHPSRPGRDSPSFFSAGGGSNGAELAGRYASGVIGAVFTIEDARNQREAARGAGRDPDEVKFFAGVSPAIGATKREALDRRVALGELTDRARAPYLGAMQNLPATLNVSKPRRAPHARAVGGGEASPSPFDPRIVRALEVARDGWTIRDILAHGVIDSTPPPSVLHR
ncbi:LLM class flavin-dependent oxidoreductase [Nocardia sp. NPDC127606]|uniref:LLM class flavin-dependent oxidoreductase n=1 Tax=Nocardia sp. NPDC127606 TaxID=3345406 RepID=UPI003635742E